MNMSLADFQSTITQYMKASDMIYLIVGDKATQLQEVNQLTEKVIQLDTNGNPLSTAEY